MSKPNYPTPIAVQWAAVDAYFAELLTPDDRALTAALAANAAAGLPAHDVSAPQGQLLALLIQMTAATRVLEIGTLGGYSTIRMARALPVGGTIVTIEADPERAEVARANMATAGVLDRIDLRVGPALDVLPALAAPFDFIFIDADKPNNPAYLRHALALSRPGTVIVADNVVRAGAVVDAESSDANVQGVRSFLGTVSAEARLAATAIQTVGSKGWDGFVIARVTD